MVTFGNICAMHCHGDVTLQEDVYSRQVPLTIAVNCTFITPTSTAEALPDDD